MPATAHRVGRAPEECSATRVVVAADAHGALVAEVGCFAAATFLSVVLDAVPDRSGQFVVETSARSLARRLGIDKDTAARILAALVAAGYLERLPQPRTGGRFGPARYQVLLPTGISLKAEAAPTGTDSPRRPRTTRTRARDADDGRGQLGLFPPSSHTDTGIHPMTLDPRPAPPDTASTPAPPSQATPRTDDADRSHTPDEPSPTRLRYARSDPFTNWHSRMRNRPWSAASDAATRAPTVASPAAPCAARLGQLPVADLGEVFTTRPSAAHPASCVGFSAHSPIEGLTPVPTDTDYAACETSSFCQRPSNGARPCGPDASGCGPGPQGPPRTRPLGPAVSKDPAAVRPAVRDAVSSPSHHPPMTDWLSIAAEASDLAARHRRRPRFPSRRLGSRVLPLRSGR